METEGTTTGTEGTSEELALPALGSSGSQAEESSQKGPVTLDPSSLETLAKALAPAVLASVKEGLRPDLDKALQSVKDSRLGKTEKLMPLADLSAADIKRVVDVFKASGEDENRAELELGIRAILEERRQPKSQPQEEVKPTPQAPSQPDPAKVEAERRARVLKLLGRSKLEDGVKQGVLKQWGAKQFASETESLEELTGLLEDARSNPEAFLPNEADLVQPAGRPVGTDANKAAAVTRLLDELAELNKNPSVNAVRRADVLKRLRELGEENV